MTYRKQVFMEHEFLLRNVEIEEIQGRLKAARKETMIVQSGAELTKLNLDSMDDALGSAIGNIQSVLRAIRKAKRQVEQAAMAEMDADMDRRYNGQG